MTYSMSDLLQLVVAEGFCDLHIRVGFPPVIRVHGVLQRVEGPPLRSEDSDELLRSITSEECLQHVRQDGGADFGFAFGDAAGLRVSADCSFSESQMPAIIRGQSKPYAYRSMKPPNSFAQTGLQNHRRVRTLLVDDSEFMRALLTMLIEESGFELVGTAADGRQALRSVAALRPDLVLMDVNMPGMDGLEATRSIKESGKRSGYAPVIVLVTSEDTLECRSQAEDAGANGFVSKSEDLRGQLKSTLDNLFSGDCESMSACLVEI
jgi:CheY-like chemotaxis protein